MGFAPDRVRAAIQQCDGNAAVALDTLLAEAATPTAIPTSSSAAAVDADDEDYNAFLASVDAEHEHAAAHDADEFDEPEVDANPYRSKPAASSAPPRGPTIIYSKLPDFQAHAKASSPLSVKRGLSGGGDAAYDPYGDADDVKRNASLDKLLQLAEAAPEQSASKQIADQLRSLLYTDDGKRKPVARKVGGNVPVPRRKPATASSPPNGHAGHALPPTPSAPPLASAALKGSSVHDAGGGVHELGTASPMHIIHFAMLRDGTGVTLSINAFDGRKYAKSFLGATALDWLVENCKACSRDRGLEICQKLVRGRFLLQIDYKEDVRPFAVTEVYRLNPKSKLLLPGATPPVILLASEMSVPMPDMIASLPMPVVQPTPAPLSAPPKAPRADGASSGRAMSVGGVASLLPAAAPAASGLPIARQPSMPTAVTAAAPAPARHTANGMSSLIGNAAAAAPARGSGSSILSRNSGSQADGRSASQQVLATPALGAAAPVNALPARSIYQQAPSAGVGSVAKPAAYDSMPDAPPATASDGASGGTDAATEAEFATFVHFEWYHQRISKTTAEELVGSTPGNFLLRDSSKPGCLCITYVSSKRGVSHVLVEKANGRWTMKGALTDWATVPDLLTTYAKVYQQAVPPPGGPIGGSGGGGSRKR